MGEVTQRHNNTHWNAKDRQWRDKSRVGYTAATRMNAVCLDASKVLSIECVWTDGERRSKRSCHGGGRRWLCGEGQWDRRETLQIPSSNRTSVHGEAASKSRPRCAQERSPGKMGRRTGAHSRGSRKGWNDPRDLERRDRLRRRG